MLLVPRQLQRAGMTGSVPYYGGRFTPEQAYAAAHPARPKPQPPPQPQAQPRTRRRSAAAQAADPLQALQHLLDSGVISTAEYQTLRARVTA